MAQKNSYLRSRNFRFI